MRNQWTVLFLYWFWRTNCMFSAPVRKRSRKTVAGTDVLSESAATKTTTVSLTSAPASLLSTHECITGFPLPSLYSWIYYCIPSPFSLLVNLLLYFLPPSLYSWIYYSIPPPFLYSWIYYCISSPLLSTREFITVFPPPSLYSSIYYCIPSPFSLLVNLLLYSSPLLSTRQFITVFPPPFSLLVNLLLYSLPLFSTHEFITVFPPPSLYSWIYYCSSSAFSLLVNLLL